MLLNLGTDNVTTKENYTATSSIHDSENNSLCLETRETNIF